MSKLFKLILSIALFLSLATLSQLPSTLASETPSRREEVGEQVFSEEELEEYVVKQSGYMAFEEELVYSIDELAQVFAEVFMPLSQGEVVGEDDLLEIAPTPSRHTELGTQNMYSWIAVGDLEVILLEAHTGEDGGIIRFSQTLRTPKMFLPLSLTEAELLEIQAEQGRIEDLFRLLGEPERTSMMDGEAATYYWNTLGGSEIQTGDLVELEVTATAAGEIEDVNYRIYE